MSDDNKQEPAMPEGAWTFDFEKMPPTALIALGRAMCLAELVERFAPFALKTLDLRERSALDKVIRTLESERKTAMAGAIEMAKQAGAAKRQVFAPTTETTQ